MVRAQRSAAGMFPHFGLFALVTAGRDTGSLEFERSALAGQLEIAIRGVTAVTARDVRSRITAGRTEVSGSPPRCRRTSVTWSSTRAEPAGGYYRDLCFKVNAYADGEPWEVGDGGFTDWTARLTANQKERLLILGLSTDRLAAFAPPGQGR